MRALLDETRFRFASESLGQTPINVVAQRLGYSDERAFDRAFRRWAGTSPMNFCRTAHHKSRAGGPRRQLAACRAPPFLDKPMPVVRD